LVFYAQASTFVSKSNARANIKEPLHHLRKGLHTMSQPQGKSLMIAVTILVIAVLGYYVLNAPDRRNASEKMSDAINELPKGLDKASRQLENRTPGEKLSDAAKDAGDDVKKATNQQ
jgi:cell division protein FtsL